MDKIQIRNLEVFGHHGVFPEENKLGQKFLVNAVLFVNLHEAGLEDDLQKSVDYGEVCHYITGFMRDQTYKLIESAAERLAEKLLDHFERLEKVELEIKKPWAPIGLPLESVSVKIARGWHTAYLSLGSNIGDREKYLDNALEALKELRGTKVLQVTRFLETEPYGKTDQDAFLNTAAAIRTQMQPLELLKEIHRIEQKNGRERVVHWGPRTLDIDIIFYDKLVMESEELTVPHPDLENRGFVLGPLMELNRYYRHPVSGKTIACLYKELGQRAMAELL
ncbi:MAG: 2-amino-4-hydroxy-6-hydroxymethyldihydropteridine diphosphokinase [Eubacterium sp.]|nr:2-amino-4-hydroxy-6-hydroxymethyldihydropteridine diphosphokinase [Eubacterium sp.]